MPVVERALALFAGSEHGDMRRHHADAVFAAVLVAEDFTETPMRINPAGESVVAAAQERDVVFHSAEHGGGRVLPLLGAFAKPAVVGQVYEKIRVVIHVFADELRERVLEAYQRRGLDSSVGRGC